MFILVFPKLDLLTSNIWFRDLEFKFYFLHDFEDFVISKSFIDKFEQLFAEKYEKNLCLVKPKLTLNSSNP